MARSILAPLRERIQVVGVGGGGRRSGNAHERARDVAGRDRARFERDDGRERRERRAGSMSTGRSARPPSSPTCREWSRRACRTRLTPRRRGGAWDRRQQPGLARGVLSCHQPNGPRGSATRRSTPKTKYDRGHEHERDRQRNPRPRAEANEVDEEQRAGRQHEAGDFGEDDVQRRSRAAARRTSRARQAATPSAPRAPPRPVDAAGGTRGRFRRSRRQAR